MDTPILPDHDSEDDREHRRFTRTADVLRIVAAALAVAASLIGLASRVHLHHASPAPDLSAITGYDGRIVIYGDLTSPQASRPGKRNDPARVVCNDEVRWEPTSGHWHCAGYATLGDKDVGRVARDPGGPCTHRIAGPNSPAWKCVTKQAVPLSARYPSYPGPPRARRDLRRNARRFRLLLRGGASEQDARRVDVHELAADSCRVPLQGGRRAARPVRLPRRRSANGRVVVRPADTRALTTR